MESVIVLIASLVVLGVILLAGSSRRDAVQGSFFDRVSTKEIQGFLAVFIVFHQTIVLLLNFDINVGKMIFFYPYGILAVAFFFFCSGFGLIRRWMTDTNYIKGFMRRRIFTVLVPFFICNYIYLTDALVSNIRIGSHFGFGEVICSFFGLFLVNSQMWFAVEIMILYAAFRIVFARVKKPLTGILIMTVIVLIMMAIGLVSGHSDSPIMSYWFKGEWWYNTILMFPAGMFYAYYEDSINKVIRKGFVAVIIISSLLFIAMDYVHKRLLDINVYWREYFADSNHFLYKLAGLGQETVFELLFLIIIIAVMSKIKIGNPVLRYLGKISLEIIMINYLMIGSLYFVYERFGMGVYLILVLISTLVCASLIYIIKNLVLERKSGLFDGKIQ